MSRGSIQSEECPECGLVYGKWHPNALNYSEAYVIVFQESRRRAELGDYSLPASRKHVLMTMRAAKVAEWEGHLYQCGEIAAITQELDL